MTTAEQQPTGRIDFTLMYATHDAFRRDLTRLTAAADAGRADTPGVQAGWQNFKRQLVVHHTVEDAALWPRLKAAVADRHSDLVLVEEMEAEHESLDPLLAAVDEAMTHGGSQQLSSLVHRLETALGDHMAHEEKSALPLIQEVLTEADWGAFRKAMARRQGPSGAAAYVPWILDEATPEQRRGFLAAMPGPVGVVNRLFWERRYRKRGVWSI